LVCNPCLYENNEEQYEKEYNTTQQHTLKFFSFLFLFTEMYIETSSKDGTNVTTMYDTMARLARDMVDKEAHGNLLG
jgi:hypothetical protein